MNIYHFNNKKYYNTRMSLFKSVFKPIKRSSTSSLLGINNLSKNTKISMFRRHHSESCILNQFDLMKSKLTWKSFLDEYEIGYKNIYFPISYKESNENKKYKPDFLLSFRHQTPEHLFKWYLVPFYITSSKTL